MQSAGAIPANQDAWRADGRTVPIFPTVLVMSPVAGCAQLSIAVHAVPSDCPSKARTRNLGRAGSMHRRTIREAEGRKSFWRLSISHHRCSRSTPACWVSRDLIRPDNTEQFSSGRVQSARLVPQATSAAPLVGDPPMAWGKPVDRQWTNAGNSRTRTLAASQNQVAAAPLHRTPHVHRRMCHAAARSRPAPEGHRHVWPPVAPHP